MHTAWQLGSSAWAMHAVPMCWTAQKEQRGLEARAPSEAERAEWAQRLAQLALFRERALCLREAATLLEEGIAGLRAQARIPLESPSRGC